MDMMPQEILKEFKEAKNHKAQIAILADENLCTKEEIINILKENGVTEEELGIARKGRPKKKEEEKGTEKEEKRKESETAAVLEETKSERAQRSNTRIAIFPEVRRAVAKEMTAIQERIDQLGKELDGLGRELEILSRFLEETREECACS